MSRQSRQFYLLICSILIAAAFGVLDAGSFRNAAVAEAPQKGIGLAGDISVQIYVDRAENKAFLDAQADSGVQGIVYELAEPSADKIMVQPAQRDLMAVWKGGGEIALANDDTADDAIYWWSLEAAQFAPVLLIVGVTNGGSKGRQIVGGHLEVEGSSVDLQPFLLITPTDICAGEGGGMPTRFDPIFYFQNLGWGGVNTSNLTFGFRNKTSSPIGAFTTNLGDFDQQTKVSVLDALKAAGLNIDRITKEKFPCDSEEHAERCLGKLAKTGIFGELKNSVFADWLTVNTTASGTIDYDWKDSQGTSHSRQSPFSVGIPLLQFNYEGPECGGAGPVERDYKPVKLSLDRKDYRIPLSYSGEVKPHQERRFALALVADKSSQHVFKVVLELADGSTVSSPTIDLLYFMPRFPQTN